WRLCLGQFFFDDFEEYPTVKPFEAGKFQRFVPQVDAPFGTGHSRGPLSPILENAYIPEDVLAVLQASRNSTSEESYTVTSKALGEQSQGRASALFAPEGEAISSGRQSNRKRLEFQSSVHPPAVRIEEAATPGRRQPKQPDSSSHFYRSSSKIKVQTLDEDTAPEAADTSKTEDGKSGRRFSPHPLAEHLQKASHIIRAERPSAELRERADEVLRDIRRGSNNTELADAIATLPVDMIVKFGTVTADPYVIVRCRKGFEAVSTTLCAAPLGEEIPILGSCLGAATFDRDTGHCFTVSEVEPISACPIGYRIARTPLDYQYGPCRPIERIPAIPSCDSPFVLDPAVGRCLYNSTHPGYLGCPPGARSLNETACAVAKQVLKTPECPPGNEKILLRDGTAECRKTVKSRGDYLARPRCRGGAQEKLNYDLYDENNHPVVTCISTQVTKGIASCPPKTVPYREYIKKGNDPPVIYDNTLGSPDRTCVEVVEGLIRPSCHEMSKQVPFVLLNRGEREPFDYRLMLPLAVVEQVIQPDWSKYEKHTGESGKEYYTREDLEISIHCLEFHYAQPVMRCPNGTMQWDLNLQECKRKGFVDFVLTCPPGYVLNELGLVFSPYNMPKPKCIAKLRASTQYYCPEVRRLTKRCWRTSEKEEVRTLEQRS
ncbi:transmembrane protein, partial [Cystoisospora suis]